MTKTRVLMLCSLLFLLTGAWGQEGSLDDLCRPALVRLHEMYAMAIPDWKAHADNIAHGEDPALNDADWTAWQASEPWRGGPVWFRRWVEIPPTLGGYDVRGARIRLDVRVGAEMSSEMRLFLNGAIAEKADENTQQAVLLTQNAQPGEKVLVAVDVPTAAAAVQIVNAQLLVDYPPSRPDPRLLYEEIKSLQELISGFPQGRREREQQLGAAVQAIDFATLDRGDQANFENSLRAAQVKLQPLEAWAKQFTVRAVGNSHIDMAWLWPWTETVEVVRNTFSTVLQLMRQYPDFYYAQSAAQDYAWMEEKYPAIFQAIQQRVKEGRWEILGGMWVEPDLNMPTGESLVRQILVGKRYFEQKFGVDVKIGWNPDSFGYNWQLPQIYKRSGIDYFMTAKLIWNDTTKFPYKLFRWQSPDGSRVLTYLPRSYGGGIDPVQISEDVATYASQMGINEMLHPFGVGDHGGGPTRAMLDAAEDWMKTPNTFPTLKLSTAQGFFDDIEKNQDRLSIPAWNNELYLQYHRGVLTTQSEMKKRVRQSEELLLNAEKFSSLAMLGGLDYPQEQLNDDWKKVLFNQFHDLMPGSGVATIYVDAARDLSNVKLSGEKILSDSLGSLAARINTQGLGIPVVIFNPLGWSRTDIAEVQAQFPSPVGEVEVRDPSGAVVPAAVFSRDDVTHTLKIRLLAGSVPALGYKVYRLVPAAHPAPGSTLRATAAGMENEFLSLKIDPRTGCITSLVNKQNGRETLAAGACGNLLQAFVDKPREWDAWDIDHRFGHQMWNMDAWNLDPDFEAHTSNLTEAEEVKLIENTPVRAVIRVKRKFQNSSFVQDICVYPGVPRVDVHMQVDWHEKHVLLKVAFPLSVQSDYATYEIPYGTIRRPTTRNTPEERAMFEVPALQWGDLSDAQHGFSLLNASKYGYDTKGNTIRLSLLRAITFPDPHADEGFHEFTYSMYPHAGDWKSAGTMRRGYELNFPFIPVPAAPHEGVFPAERTLVSIEPDNVILTAIKKAEDGRALVFRFFEFEGKAVEVRLRFPEAGSSVLQVNLMEKQGAPLPLQDGGRQTTLTVHPYEIVTVKALFGKSAQNSEGEEIPTTPGKRK